MLTTHLREVVQLLRGHGASAITALIVAELFFKFHSFTLEALAFLTTWYVIDALVQDLGRLVASWWRSARAT